MTEQNRQNVCCVLRRMHEIVAPMEGALVPGHKGAPAPTASLRRSLINLEQELASKGDPSFAGAPLDFSGAPGRLGFHLNMVRRVLEVKDRQSPLSSSARALLSLAEVYQSLGDSTAALRIFQRWLQRNDAHRELAMRSHVQLQLGSIHADLGEWAAAGQAISDALAIMATLRDQAGTISAHIVLGKIAYKQGKYPQARERFEQALRLAEDINDVRRIGTIKMQLGVIARMQCRSNYALACFQDALIQFQSAQDDAGTAECLSHLGVLHLQNGRLREAGGCIEKSISLCRDNGWSLVLAYGYLNKAAVQIEAKDCALAASTCGKGLELMARMDNTPGLAKAARLCAQVLSAVGPRAAARGFLEISMELYDKFSIPLGLANCHLDMAHLLHHDADAASAHLARAREIFKSLDLPVNLDNAQRSLRQSAKKDQINSIALEET